MGGLQLSSLLLKFGLRSVHVGNFMKTFQGYCLDVIRAFCLYAVNASVSFHEYIPKGKANNLAISKYIKKKNKYLSLFLDFSFPIFEVP